MQRNKDKTIELEKVIGSKLQISALYELLKKKKFNISNVVIPKYVEHKEFVLKHPYRIWYLIKLNNQYIGTAYILKSNAIGISIEGHEKLMLMQVLSFLIRRHKPLREIKSVRPPYFYFNASPKNLTLISTLRRFGIKEIQRTFLLP